MTAVARAFAILRCYKRGERSLGNKDMAARTGLPRSTIARLTHTLTEQRMKNLQQFFFPSYAWWSILCFLLSLSPAFAADKLVGIHSSRTMSQSMPWIAQEAGIFKKYDLDFQLVFIASSGMVTAALLGGDAEMTLTGGVGNVRGYVQGVTDLVFIGSAKNVITQNIVAAPSIKRPEDLKGKKIAITRIGGNSQYFTIQAMRKHNIEAGRDFTFIQTGGDPESVAALFSGAIDTAVLTPPSDAQASRTVFIILSTVPT